MKGSWPLAVSLFGIASCTVGDVDYLGKNCTTACPDALTCVDGSCARVDSLVYVTQLHAEWGTPNSIRWAWTMNGNGPDLESYELAITSDTPGAPGVKTWTSKDSAELGSYQLRRSDGFDLVSGTITDGLAPQTSYTAVLKVHDTYGHTFSTAPVRGSTDTQRELRVPIFAGALPEGGYLIPAAPAFVIAPKSGVDGGAALHYERALDPESTPTGGYQNLRLAADLPLDASLSAKVFATAYLEFWISGKGNPTSSWSEIWMRLKQADGSPCANVDDCIWSYPSKWVYHPDLSSPAYRRVQVPISELARHVGSNELLRPEDLGRHLAEVNVGCQYLESTDTTDLDRIGVWW